MSTNETTTPVILKTTGSDATQALVNLMVVAEVCQEVDDAKGSTNPETTGTSATEGQALPSEIGSTETGGCTAEKGVHTSVGTLTLPGAVLKPWKSTKADDRPKPAPRETYEPMATTPTHAPTPAAAKTSPAPEAEPKKTVALKKGDTVKGKALSLPEGKDGFRLFRLANGQMGQLLAKFAKGGKERITSIKEGEEVTLTVWGHKKDSCGNFTGLVMLTEQEVKDGKQNLLNQVLNARGTTVQFTVTSFKDGKFKNEAGENVYLRAICIGEFFLPLESGKELKVIGRVPIQEVALLGRYDCRESIDYLEVGDEFPAKILNAEMEERDGRDGKYTLVVVKLSAREPEVYQLLEDMKSHPVDGYVCGHNGGEDYLVRLERAHYALRGVLPKGELDHPGTRGEVGAVLVTSYSKEVDGRGWPQEILLKKVPAQPKRDRAPRYGDFEEDAPAGGKKLSKEERRAARRQGKQR